MDGPHPPVITVSELTDQIRRQFQESFPRIRVRGEISNLRRQSSGHIYFSLKDQGAQLSAVLFRGSALRIELDPRDGMQVEAGGEIDVYPPRGSYQLIVRSLRHDGEGSLQAAFEALKSKLLKEGLFEASLKNPLPQLPQTIGLITSPSGAALRDVISVFQRRGWNGRLLLFPTSVQGPGSVDSIIAQLALAEQSGLCDALILARGGGSLEDLWSFNEEAVVRAVVATRLPVISAVGHETDFVLTDFAADRRAETPTAAAEIFTSYFVTFRERGQQIGRALDLYRQRGTNEARKRLDALARTLAAVSPRHALQTAQQKVDEKGQIWEQAMANSLAGHRTALDHLQTRWKTRLMEERVHRGIAQTSEIGRRLDRLWNRSGQTLRERLQSLSQRLEGTSLQGTLRRGFALVENAEGHLVTRVDGIQPDEEVVLRFADGRRAAKAGEKVD